MSERYRYINVTPENPNRVSITDTGRLSAQGDETHLVACRGPRSTDDDASWRQVLSHLRKYGMVLACEDEFPQGDSVTVRALLYTIPSRRMWVNDPANAGAIRRYLAQLAAVLAGVRR